MASSVVFNPFTKKLDFSGSSTTSVVSGTIKARQLLTPDPDDVTTVFTLPDNFTSNTVTIYVNGLAESHITETGANQITFETAPWTGAELRASYELYGSVVAPSSTYGSGLYGTATYA